MTLAGEAAQLLAPFARKAKSMSFSDDAGLAMRGGYWTDIAAKNTKRFRGLAVIPDVV